MRDAVDVVIVGAGPYGLSLAAHLQSARVNFRIFGTPMQTWTSQMPQGMCLKSEGFASTLYDPHSAFTLKRFCEEKNLPYADVGLPVPLETFIAYGQEFQRRLVPGLEDRSVVSLKFADGSFRLELDNGESVSARQVVVAAGISKFQYLPSMFANISREFLTHSSQHVSLEKFVGKDITVLGAGASALDLAALLKAAGATVRVVARRPAIRFHNPPGKLPRPLRERLSAPMTGLGPGWRSFAAVKGPLLFHKLPLGFRMEVVRRHLGPAPAWFTRKAVEGHVELLVSTTVQGVHVDGGRVCLELNSPTGKRSVETDHVIAATGFRVDLQRLAFLSDDLRRSIHVAESAPVLSTSFESSVPGLYFIGAAAAPSFGPLLRFAYGAQFTASRLSRKLVRKTARPNRWSQAVRLSNPSTNG